MAAVTAELPPRTAAVLSEKALKLAGLALAPERHDSEDRALARLLLQEAFVGAARSITNLETLMSASQARDALAASDHLPTHLRKKLRSTYALDAVVLPSSRELLEVEATVTAVVRFANGKQGLLRGHGRLLAAISALTGLLAILLPRLSPAPAWGAYTWQASSTVSGYPLSGKLAPLKDGLLFHTAKQRGPSLVIDMKAPRKVREIVIKNRQDCCAERGLPLIVEVGDRLDSFVLVGRQADVFSEWDVTFPERTARYVRLRSTATTYLHLGEISIP